jgi:hypothetical protein
MQDLTPMTLCLEPEQQLDDFIELGVLLAFGTRFNRVTYAVLQVLLENIRLYDLDGSLNRLKLMQDVDTVPFFFDHPLDAAYLSLDPLQARDLFSMSRNDLSHD